MVDGAQGGSQVQRLRFDTQRGVREHAGQTDFVYEPAQPVDFPDDRIQGFHFFDVRAFVFVVKLLPAFPAADFSFKPAQGFEASMELLFRDGQDVLRRLVRAEDGFGHLREGRPTTVPHLR